MALNNRNPDLVTRVTALSYFPIAFLAVIFFGGPFSIGRLLVMLVVVVISIVGIVTQKMLLRSVASGILGLAVIIPALAIIPIRRNAIFELANLDVGFERTLVLERFSYYFDLLMQYSIYTILGAIGLFSIAISDRLIQKKGDVCS